MFIGAIQHVVVKVEYRRVGEHFVGVIRTPGDGGIVRCINRIGGNALGPEEWQVSDLVTGFGPVKNGGVNHARNNIGWLSAYEAVVSHSIEIGQNILGIRAALRPAAVATELNFRRVWLAGR